MQGNQVGDFLEPEKTWHRDDSSRSQKAQMVLNVRERCKCISEIAWPGAMVFYRQPDLQSQHPLGFPLSWSCDFARSLSWGLLLHGSAVTCLWRTQPGSVGMVLVSVAFGEEERDEGLGGGELLMSRSASASCLLLLV